MRKKIGLLLLVESCLISVSACGNKAVSNNNDVSNSFQIEETSHSMDTKANQDSIIDETEKLSEFEELNKIVSIDIESTISSIRADYEKLVTDIDTYEKYLNNTDRTELFYEQICEDTQYLCIRLREYSINYAKEIMTSDKSNNDKYKDFEKLYDDIYDDAGEEIYDEIYDGILDEIYDDFYDGLLDDAYDNVSSYDEWFDARSEEYDWWSAARSNVYDEWSDFRSDVYEFWSDMRSELWDDNIERAEEKIVDFQKDIEKIKSKAIPSDIQVLDEENKVDKTSEVVENNESNTDDELIDGMRLEFKEAMDSYEAFYNEYCDIMKKYAENPSDLKLLAQYTDMLIKAAEMAEKFEAWENNDMNSVELKYYLDVNNRVTKKLLELSE